MARAPDLAIPGLYEHSPGPHRERVAMAPRRSWRPESGTGPRSRWSPAPTGLVEPDPGLWRLDARM